MSLSSGGGGIEIDIDIALVLRSMIAVPFMEEVMFGISMVAAMVRGVMVVIGIAAVMNVIAAVDTA